MSQNGHHKKSAVQLLYDDETKTLQVKRDEEIVPNWEFCLALLAVAVNQVEFQIEMQKMQHMQQAAQQQAVQQQMQQQLLGKLVLPR